MSSSKRGAAGDPGGETALSREAFAQSLARRLLLFSRELSGLAGELGEGAQGERDVVTGKVEGLLRAVAGIESQLHAALRCGADEWGEQRAILERRWRELRREFERLAAACGMRHVAGREPIRRGPQR